MPQGQQKGRETIPATRLRINRRAMVASKNPLSWDPSSNGEKQNRKLNVSETTQERIEAALSVTQPQILPRSRAQWIEVETKAESRALIFEAQSRCELIFSIDGPNDQLFISCVLKVLRKFLSSEALLGCVTAKKIRNNVSIEGNKTAQKRQKRRRQQTRNYLF